MKMNKLYFEVFTETMETAGFKRKGVLYYRIKGEILQGVLLKMINPYDICVNICPWWTYLLMRYSENELSDGQWVEDGLNIPGIYYRESRPEQNQQAMRGCLAVFKERLLPKLDCISDEDAYIQAVYDHTLELPPEEREARYQEHQARGADVFVGMITGELRQNPYALLHKAVRNGSYEAITAMLPDALHRREVALRRMNQNGYHAINPAVLDAYRTNAAYRQSVDGMVRDDVDMMSAITPDVPESQLLAEAKERFIPWEVKPMPTEDEWVREELKGYEVSFFGGQALYAAVQTADFDTPRALYEKNAADMKGLILNRLGMKV